MISRDDGTQAQPADLLQVGMSNTTSVANSSGMTGFDQPQKVKRQYSQVRRNRRKGKSCPTLRAQPFMAIKIHAENAG